MNNHLERYVEAVAVSAASMSQGVSWKQSFLAICSEQFGWGQVEAYHELAALAMISAVMLLDINLTGISPPGVYTYEVDELIGKEFQLSIYANEYDPAKLRLKLGKLAAEFFVNTANQETILPIIKKHTGYDCEV